MTLKVLVVDDEPVARRLLRADLCRFEDIEVVGECSRGREVVEAVRTQVPDVVFLDIGLGDVDGVQVAAELNRIDNGPLVIFVTAYDSRAIEAFEVNALDYLLKPYDPQRLRATIERAIEYHGRVDEWRGAVAESASLMADKDRLPQQFVARSVGRIDIVRAADLVWVGSAGNYVELHTDSGRVMYRATLRSMKKQLQGDEWLQVHRCAMIRLSGVRQVRYLRSGSVLVTMTDGNDVPVSDSCRGRLTRRLEELQG